MNRQKILLSIKNQIFHLIASVLFVHNQLYYILYTLFNGVIVNLKYVLLLAIAILICLLMYLTIFEEEKLNCEPEQIELPDNALYPKSSVGNQPSINSLPTNQTENEVKQHVKEDDKPTQNKPSLMETNASRKKQITKENYTPEERAEIERYFTAKIEERFYQNIYSKLNENYDISSVRCELSVCQLSLLVIGKNRQLNDADYTDQVLHELSWGIPDFQRFAYTRSDNPNEFSVTYTFDVNQFQMKY